MANVEINDLDPKATPELTDEYELQQTGGGLSFKSTFQGLANLFATLFAPLSSVVTKATGAELDTGTNDTKFATAKALKDSKNVPSVAPGTSGNVLTSDGTDWSSQAAGGGGAIDWANPIAINTATTLTIGKHHVISDLGSPADYTVTLPAVAGNAGKLISWEMAAALTKLVTVDGNASETIDGELTRVMWAKETAVLSCDGTTWTKVAGKSIPMSISVSLSASIFGLTSGVYAKVTFDTTDESNGLVLSGSNITVRRTGKLLMEFQPAYGSGGNTFVRTISVLYVGGSIDTSTYFKDDNGSFVSSSTVQGGHRFYNTTVGEVLSFHSYVAVNTGTWVIRDNSTAQLVEELSW